MTFLELLKVFTYHFVSSFENTLIEWKKCLDGCPDKREPNTISKLAAKATYGVPTVGRVLSNSVIHLDEYLQGRCAANHAFTMAEIVYHFDNNRISFRMVLIKTAYEIFRVYEHQFLLVYCNGGPRRAMQRLGIDGAHRAISYVLENDDITKITPKILTKGVVLGNSQRHPKKILLRGKKLFIKGNGKEIRSPEFFTRTGIRIKENGVLTCYKNGNSVKELGHRIAFSWEDHGYVKTTYEVDRPECSYKTQFASNNEDEYFEILRHYIATKNPHEDIKELVNAKTKRFDDAIVNLKIENKEMMSEFEESMAVQLNGTRTFLKEVCRPRMKWFLHACSSLSHLHAPPAL